VKILKTKKNWLAATVLAILLLPLAAPMFAGNVTALLMNTLIEEQSGWKKIETEVMTILFPTGGRKPMFLWWYNKEPDKVYVVKYQGLIEFFAFDEPLYYYRAVYDATWERLRLRYMAMGWNGLPLQLRESLRKIYENWHAPYLSFSGSTWQLFDVRNITADGKVVGLTFAFKLVKVPFWTPRFEFAEGNIMIRNRFYFEPVNEVVGGHEYTVNAGEMKMDLVISNWKWNLDTLKPLLNELKERGIEIPEGRTGLALWINLASINITRITPEQAETAESVSTTADMTIENTTVSVVQNRTGYDETPIIARKRLFENYRIKFIKAKDDTTLTGFFKFVSSAKVTYSEGNLQLVNVTASYIEAGAHMRLFIGYPYFGGGTLEHDPSLGLEVPETTTPEATNPVYTIIVPSGINQIEPKVLPALTTTQLAMVVVGIVTTAAALIYVVKWKRKTPINVVGAK
jgi:hypothetical protein